MRQFIRQGLRFGAVGVINTGFGLLAIYAVMYFWKAGPLLANGIGYVIGLTVSFTLNRSWTFGHTGVIQHALPRYFLVIGLGYLCNFILVYYGIHYLNLNSYLVQPAGIVVYSSITFFGCRYIVFR